MTLIAPKSRNDPCPCGSGKRYKACHGGGAPPPAPAAVPASAHPTERARAALRVGAFAEAASILEREYGPEPGDAATLKLYAEALRPVDPARSKSLWERAHAMARDDPEPLFFLGDFASAAGDYPRAIERFEQALARDPGHPALLNNLGLAYEKIHDFSRAAASFERALELAPGDVNPLANLAQNYYQQQRFREAIALFERLVKAMPQAPAAIWANFGVSLRRMKRFAQARSCFTRATELAPDLPSPWRDLGATLMEEKDYGPAILALRRAAELDPGDLLCEAYLMHACGYECVWDRFDQLRASILDRAGRSDSDPRNVPTPFSIQPVNDDPDLERVIAVGWTAREFLPVAPARPPRRAAPQRLRVAFLSPDFSAHPVGRLIAPVLERVHRARFEILGYDTRPQRDGMGLRIRAAFERYRELSDADPLDIASTIRADEVDVLFELSGHTADSNLSVMSLRPAPVQVSWLGYTGTTGSPAIDWIVTDPFCIPPERADTCIERLLHVEPCYLPCAGDGIDPSVRVTRGDYRLPNDALVLAVMSGGYKIMPGQFDAWLQILHALPDAMLWIRSIGASTVQRLRVRAASAGLDPQRLRVVRDEPAPRYLARFQLADLFLDTFPFGSHTAVNDALSTGLPVLTQAGQTFASRASASQVRAAGLPELVTGSLADYVETAIALGRDRARLGALRERLVTNRSARVAFFDPDAFTRSLEAAIERAWSETPAD